MVGAAIAPGPAAGQVEHCEFLARLEWRDNLRLRAGPLPDRARARAAPPRDRPGIMRREQLARQRDVGDVGAIGVDARIELERRAAQGESLSRAGRGILFPFACGARSLPAARYCVRSAQETPALCWFARRTRYA